MGDKSLRIKELVEILNKAAKSYYAEDEEIMSNFEYDRLYDELVSLEEETGIVLTNSPTRNVGYEAVDELPKERHASPMLSLGKTKSREELRDWLQDKKGLLSWKLDGLTIVLTYENGELVKAVTRGNGEVGEVITNNAKTFTNIPVRIAFKGRLILRGEAVISYPDFELINSQISDPADKYKNPRNLCSGSVRALDSSVTASRRVKFFAFTLVEAEGVDFGNSVLNRMHFLEKNGFETVTNRVVDKQNILETIEQYAEDIKTYEIPSDGLVLTYDDIEYGLSLGRTAKFPRNAIAFKWADEVKETTLKEIEWSPSRTGLINPVAIFEPVELEGTTVSRASVHNVSIMRSLKLGIGDRITVYKANMIIPQIADNLTGSNNVEIPSVCPACKGETTLEEVGEVESLYCKNPECPVKKIKSLTLFCSRDALNIDGLSEMTIEKFAEHGIVSEYADFFRLSNHRDEIVNMEGFGEKSYDNMVANADKAGETTLAKLLYGLGIANIGVATAKLISRKFNESLEACRNATPEDISEIEGLGGVIANSFCEYFRNPVRMAELENLLPYIKIAEPEIREDADKLKGLTFVITGSLNHFKDRSALKEIIEAMGGKVSGSVSSKTHALINNDVTSQSSKNKTARELGIDIISEEDFLERYGIEAQM